MRPGPGLVPATSAAITDDHGAVIQLQRSGIQNPSAPRRPISWHPVHVQAAETVGTVVAHRAATRLHGRPTVTTGEWLVDMDGVGPHLRCASAIQQSAHQALAVQPCVETAPGRLGLERCQELRLPIHCLPEPLDLSARTYTHEARKRICPFHDAAVSWAWVR